MEQTITIPGPVGGLEALVTSSEETEQQRIAVICHPHPLFGGTMHNKVVTTMMRTFRDLGMPVVRFNFRGVGASEGEFDEGRGEVEDLLAVLRWCKDHWPNAKVLQAGFSFGAYIAYYASQLWDFERLILVAPAVTRADFTRIPLPSCPWLVVQGESDEVVSPEAVFAWLDTLSPQPVIIRMPDTSHFFHGKLVELKEQLIEYLSAL